MNRMKQFKNRKNRRGNCRSYLHAYTLAKIQHKQEHFMSQRDMRVYWNDVHEPLYGPLNLMSRYLKYKLMNRPLYGSLSLMSKYLKNIN